MSHIEHNWDYGIRDCLKQKKKLFTLTSCIITPLLKHEMKFHELCSMRI